MLVLCFSGLANASVIISPDSVISNSAGNYSSDYSITSTIDQSGLSSPFTSGVTDFDDYFATSPTHSDKRGKEWWGTFGTGFGTVVYDLGAIFTIDRLALWNEESNGIYSFELYSDTASDFSSQFYLGTFSPTDNIDNDDYLADIFSLTSKEARYVRLEMTGVVPILSMGEIAFSARTPVPEPATMLLFGLGLLGLAGVNRKKQ